MILWKKMAYPPLSKRELGPSIAEGPQEIRNFPSP